MVSRLILIAEDEDVLAYALQLKFKEAGYVVKIVSSGDDVLKELNLNSYDFLLLDVLMPGKNGFEVLEKMLEADNKTPTFVISNLSDDKDMKLSIKLGALDYLIKTNFTLDEIVEKVNNYFDKEVKSESKAEN